MKKKSVSELKKEADKWHSLYIRVKFSDFSGYVKCVTCGVVKLWKEIQCGHYESRTKNNVRYDTRNTFPQCQGCNIWKEGNKTSYSLFQIKKLGLEGLEQLHKDAEISKQFTPQELQEIIDDRKQKVEKLLEEKGFTI